MIVILLIILGLKFLKKIIPLLLWIFIGMLSALIVSILLPALNLPDPFEWIQTTLGVET